jgi:hypothetical protein
LTVLVLCAATVTTFLQKIEADRQRDAAQFEARRAESANEFLDFLLQSDGGTSQARSRPLRALNWALACSSSNIAAIRALRGACWLSSATNIAVRPLHARPLRWTTARMR